LAGFHKALTDAGNEITKQNKIRVSNWGELIPQDVAKNWAYEYLLPEKIPQSINI
jgi:hypothetical protein